MTNKPIATQKDKKNNTETSVWRFKTKSGKEGLAIKETKMTFVYFYEEKDDNKQDLDMNQFEE